MHYLSRLTGRIPHHLLRTISDGGSMTAEFYGKMLLFFWRFVRIRYRAWRAVFDRFFGYTG